MKERVNVPTRQGCVCPGSRMDACDAQNGQNPRSLRGLNIISMPKHRHIMIRERNALAASHAEFTTPQAWGVSNRQMNVSDLGGGSRRKPSRRCHSNGGNWAVMPPGVMNDGACILASCQQPLRRPTSRGKLANLGVPWRASPPSSDEPHGTNVPTVSCSSGMNGVNLNH